jgi:hypothetical protein
VCLKVLLQRFELVQRAVQQAVDAFRFICAGKGLW